MLHAKYRKNRSNELISQKYLANANFGWCEFFPEPKIALGKDLLYINAFFRRINPWKMNKFLVQQESLALLLGL